MTRPTEIITYALRGPDGTSDSFYRDLSDFADEVLAEATARLQSTLDGLQAWVRRTHKEELRETSEYIYDCLSLGILWAVHAARTAGLPAAPRAVLDIISRLRRRGGRVEDVADVFRGLISGVWLARPQRAAAAPLPGLESLRALHDWLEATGNFEDEALRVAFLLEYLAHLPGKELSASLAAIVDFAAWFDQRSQEALGRYTPNVEHFLEHVHPGHRWKADFVFTGRTRLEYHANLVGHELLNRANRAAFLQTRQRLVLAPPCMRARPESECRAQATSFGAACRGCTPECRIHHLTRLGREHAFTVRIMPDDLRVFGAAGGDTGSEGSLGIIGISCALTNAPGGLETRQLGVPAQGVLLDYCGCRYHWHPTGIPTDVNVGRLLQVMGIAEQAEGAGD